MREIGFTSKVFTPHSIVGQLSGGERQGVAIARAIYKKADLIVLDEPTTALSLTETAKVFHFVRQVRASGRSILFIGHNIHHVFDIADRFVVLDRGARRARGAARQVRVGRGAHRFHGATGASRRAARPGGGSPMSEIRRRNPVAGREHWSHPHDRPLRRFIVGNRAPAGLAGRLRGDARDLPDRQSHRLHQLGTLQFGPHHPAGGDLPDRAARLRRDRRRDRPLLPRHDGVRRLELRAGRPGRARSLPRHPRRDRDRARARPRSSARSSSTPTSRR